MGETRLAAAEAYLPHIDGLRAFAVLAVIANHYFEELVPAGYLGVDIFFVISGFVISMNLRHSPFERPAEFLINFYSRRIKRLLPALLVCVTLTTALFVLFTTHPTVSIYITASYAVFGLSNIYLYFISFDYFSLDARLNPFTHTWSLGVEEQFYLIYPALFFASGLRLKRGVSSRPGLQLLTAMTSVSLAGYFVMFERDASGAFYLLPARFWELGLGGLSYFAYERGWRATPNFVPAIALGALATLMAINWPYQPAATAGCAFLTALLLCSMRLGDLAAGLLSRDFAVYIGKISYSLYLWHWSLLVLAKWTIGESVIVKLALLLLLPLLAAGSYHFIESPLRHATWFKSPRKTLASGLIAAGFTALIVNAGLAKLASVDNQLLARLAGIRSVEPWPKIACSGVKPSLAFDIYEKCLGGERTGEKPNFVYVIGDSHAAQLMLMMDRALEGTPYSPRFIQTGIVTDYPRAFFEPDARSVAAVDYIDAHAKPGDFVLTAFHRGLLNAHRDAHVPLSQAVEPSRNSRAYTGNMGAWSKKLTGNGIGVILVQDTPLMRVIAPVTACALQISFTGDSVCRVTLQQDLHTRKRQDMSFAAIARGLPGVVTWDAGQVIYAGRGYADVLDTDGSYIMLDWNHISAKGAERLAPAFAAFFRSILRKEHLTLTAEDRPASMQ